MPPAAGRPQGGGGCLPDTGAAGRRGVRLRGDGEDPYKGAGAWGWVAALLWGWVTELLWLWVVMLLHEWVVMVKGKEKLQLVASSYSSLLVFTHECRGYICI